MAQRVVIPGFRKIEVSGGGEGTTNYNDLTNKPSINNVPLVGNLNTSDLNLTDATLTEEGVPAEAKAVGEKFGEILQQFTTIGFETGPCTLTFGKFYNESPNTLVESCEVTGVYIKVGKMCFISLSNALLKFEKTQSTDGVVIITGGIPYSASNFNNIIGYLSVGYTHASKNLIRYWCEESSLYEPPQFEDLLKISGEMQVCLAVIYEIVD